MTQKEFKTGLEKFRKPVQENEIEFKIQSTKNDTTLIVPYVDARCVQDRLDECFGAENWKNDLKIIEGYAFETEKKGKYDKEPKKIVDFQQRGFVNTLSLKIDGEWVSKTDVSDNTDIEPLKGGASTSFRRVAVLWGCGRDLYNSPILQIPGSHKYLNDDHKKWAYKCLADSRNSGKYFYKYNVDDFIGDYKEQEHWNAASIKVINKNLTKKEVDSILKKYGVSELSELKQEELEEIREKSIKFISKMSRKDLESLIASASEIDSFDIMAFASDKLKKNLDELTYRDYHCIVREMKK